MNILIDIPDEKIHDLKIVVAISDAKSRKSWIENLVINAVDEKFKEIQENDFKAKQP